MKRQLFLLLAVSMLGTLSCRKLDDLYIEKTDTENIKNNEYPESFQWSTLQTAEVRITGLPGVPAIKRALSIESPDGAIYLKKLVNISENQLEKIQIPAMPQQIIVKCGNICITVPVNDGVAICSLQTGNPDD